MVRSAALVSFIATTTWVAGSPSPITISNGTMVQMISTVVLSWKRRPWRPRLCGA